MKASDYVVKYLVAQGVTHVFEVIGGMITHLLDSLHQDGRIKVVSVHHEQAGSFAADAFGRVKGIPGVALATSGPGATNLLTGIGSCYFDSSPAVFITGQVNRHEQKGETGVRQLGFQETDIVAMARPITKAAWMIQSAEELPARLEEAFRLALEGRPGPVLLDIPMDVQREPVPKGSIGALQNTEQRIPRKHKFSEVLDALASSTRPIILAGGGLRSGNAVEIFRKVVDAVQVPVVNSLHAVDALPYENPWRVGMIGSYGNRWANRALGSSDVLFVLGSRLDIRQTGSETKWFSEGRHIFHVDCDAAEMNNRVKGCTTYESELRPWLTGFLAEARQREPKDFSSWRAEIAEWRDELPDTKELGVENGINPNVLMHALSQASAAASSYVVDVGQHQMWAAQSLDLTADQRFLTSGGMGAMGFALPAALGAVAANGGKPVVVIAGDGGFQLNIQELETVVRNKFPIKIVILNNECHGMVRQFQESYFHERYQSTVWGYSAPDFAAVAQAYRIPSATVSQSEELDAALQQMWRDPAEPYLLQVMIPQCVNVYPKIAFGYPITEMEPFAKPLAMEGT